MCFPTILGPRPFDKQRGMWSDRADFHLMFPSARDQITFIYIPDMLTDADSVWRQCKQRLLILVLI